MKAGKRNRCSEKSCSKSQHKVELACVAVLAGGSTALCKTEVFLAARAQKMSVSVRGCVL
jgi:hypothetical protein